MIKSKTFENEAQINEFIAKNNISVISIETQKHTYDTGLPLPNGGSFINEKTELKIWYSESDEDLQTCTSCEKEFDFEIMHTDAGDNYFCPTCWKELEPVMKAEYEELKAKGELFHETE